MSETTHEPNPISTLIGALFTVAIPASMIVMLGVVGFAFYKAIGERPGPPEESEGGETAVVAPTPPPAPTDSTTPGDAPGESPPTSEPEIAAVSETVVEPDPHLMELGKTAYATCMGCHGADGKGLAAGAMKMAPSLVGSELLLGDPDVALLILHRGIKKEGMDYIGAMVGMGASLDDEKMAAVLTYVRNNFGNEAEPVTIAQAEAARAKFAQMDLPLDGVPRSDLAAVAGAE
ncbi:MAG: cytochrome c [Verrucomicrobiota bacterium]